MSEQPKTKRQAIDWEAMEADWRAGFKSVLQLSKEYGVSRAAILKHWDKEGVERDLSAKINAKSDALVLTQAKDKYSGQGFVYVIFVVDTSGDRFYKIGMASSFPARVSTHQTSSPFDVRVACAYFVGNMSAEERALHSMFDEKRIRGEWFRLSDDDLDSIAMRSRLV